MILAFVSPHRAHDIITFTCKNIFLYRFDSIIFMSVYIMYCVYFCINITRYMSFIKHTFFILLNFDFVYLLFGFFNFCFFFSNSCLDILKFLCLLRTRKKNVQQILNAWCSYVNFNFVGVLTKKQTWWYDQLFRIFSIRYGNGGSRFRWIDFY